MSSATLQDDHSVEAFLTVAETETLALFEHLHSRNSKDGKFERVVRVRLLPLRCEAQSILTGIDRFFERLPVIHQRIRDTVPSTAVDLSSDTGWPSSGTRILRDVHQRCVSPNPEHIDEDRAGKRMLHVRRVDDFRPHEEGLIVLVQRDQCPPLITAYCLIRVAPVAEGSVKS